MPSGGHLTGAIRCLFGKNEGDYAVHATESAAPVATGGQAHNSTAFFSECGGIMLSRWRPLGPRLALDTATAILRLDGSRNSDGVWSEGAEVRVPIRCSVEPMELEELEQKTGLASWQQQIVNWRKFFINAGETSRPLRPGENQANNDHIEYQGETYRVDSTLDYGVFQEVRAVRKSQ